MKAKAAGKSGGAAKGGPIGKPQGRGCKPPAPPKKVARSGKTNFKAAGEALMADRDPWASTAPPKKPSAPSGGGGGMGGSMSMAE